MGAWGEGAFDNDDGADWGGDLAESGSVETVREALAAAASLAADDYLEAPEGAEALAAAEVVAAAAGRPTKSDAYSEAPLAWAARYPAVGGQEYVTLALAAIDRVRGPESELPALWAEAEGKDSSWARAVEQVRARLTA